MGDSGQDGVIKNIVIAGGGHAGFQAAFHLRQGGYSGALTLLESSPGLPYQRPPLSKAYLNGDMASQALDFRSPAYFEKNRIDLRSEHVQRIDRQQKTVSCLSGAAFAYDHLLLAMGAQPRALAVPGAGLRGVLQLRTLDDADALALALKDARRVVVIGGGFIGMEFAAYASMAGLDVQVLEASARTMSRAASAQTAAFHESALQACGVRFAFNTVVSQIHGHGGQVRAVETADGVCHEADIVLVGVGVVPCTAMAAQCGLAVRDGITVDARLQTSDASISAIGDMASFPDPVSGEHLRLESVQNATDQARYFARRITGGADAGRYASLPWFWTEQRHHKLQIAGLQRGADRYLTIGSPRDGTFNVLCFRNDSLVAVESINNPGDHMAARKILAGERRPSHAEASEPAFSLRAWPV